MANSTTLPHISKARAAQAGTVAAMVMLASQLAWRLGWAKDPLIPAFPEFVVAAVSRLTPLSIFGAATENYGGLAKRTLFITILIVAVLVGRLAGIAAGGLANRLGGGPASRFAASGAVAGALLLFVLLVIMPIAHLGLYARDSSHTREILIQLGLTFGLYAVVWSLFTSPQLSNDPAPGDATLDRRSMLSQFALGGATLAAALAVGATTWRLLVPKQPKVDQAATQQQTQDIVATQRARQGNPLPTTEPEVETPVPETARLTADFAMQANDPLALFVELDAEEKITPVLTATPDFYHVSKNILDPEVSSDGWKLHIYGMVDKPLELTYEQLVERATTYKITTLCCISNELNGDLISTAEWLGVPLADLLTEAGVQDGALDLRFHAADDYEDSVPVVRGLDPDNLVVVGMNGEPLPATHGFPARLIIPNIYGMKNVKWIDSIEAVQDDFIGYWESRGWSDVAICQIWGRIDFPDDDLDPGPQIITGMAAAGDRSIARLEVSLDDGGSWADAILEPSLNPTFTWVRWAFPFEAVPGEYTIRIRGTDGEGATAPKNEESPLPAGATGWPKRGFKVRDE